MLFEILLRGILTTKTPA